MALCALDGRTVIVAGAGQTVFTIGWDATLVRDEDVLLWFEDVSAGTPGAEASQGAGAGQFAVDRVAGTCTLVTPAEVGDLITMERHQSSPIRKTVFTQPGDFIPSVVNNEFDHFLQLIEDLGRDRCRSIRMDRGVDLTSLDLELPTPVAGSAIGWVDATTIGNIGVLLTGSGTLGTIPLWTPDGFTLGDSALVQSGLNITAAGDVIIVGDLQVNGGDITSSTGAIAFGNENLSTTGTLASGAHTVTGNVSATGNIVSTGEAMGVTGNSVGIPIQLVCQNADFTDLGSDAQIRIQTEDSTGGDPYIEWKIGLVAQSYVMGIDNSDSDKFVGSVGAVLGTANWIEVTTAGVATFINDVILSTGDFEVTTGDANILGGFFGVGIAGSAVNEVNVSISAVGARALFNKNVDASTQATVTIRQDHVSGAVACLDLDQDDISEGFLQLVGSNRGAVPTSTVDSLASWRVKMGGTIYVVPLHVDQ